MIVTPSQNKRPRLRRDGTVSYWSYFHQEWVDRVVFVPIEELEQQLAAALLNGELALDAAERVRGVIATLPLASVPWSLAEEAAAALLARWEKLVPAAVSK